MTTAKAQYTGGAHNEVTKDFSSKLKLKLLTYAPGQRNNGHQTSQNAADAFVSALLSEVQWAISQYDFYKRELTKQQIEAEQKDILKHLQSLHIRLEKMSPDLDRLLPCSAEQLACSKSIENLIGHMEEAGRLIAQLPNRRKLSEKQHALAVGITTSALPVLNHFGVSVAATSNDYSKGASDAVQILKAIGEDIGLRYNEKTWRDLISEAKSQSRNLVETTGDEHWAKFLEPTIKQEHSFGTRGDRPQSADIDNVDE